MSNLEIAKSLIGEALEIGLRTGEQSEKEYMLYQTITGDFVLVDFKTYEDLATHVMSNPPRYRLIEVND